MGNIASNGTMVFYSLKHGDEKVGMGDIFSCIFLNFFQMIVSHGSENMCGWESVNVSVWMV